LARIQILYTLGEDNGNALLVTLKISAWAAGFHDEIPLSGHAAHAPGTPANPQACRFLFSGTASTTIFVRLQKPTGGLIALYHN
jgi:hypothetical protein